ncbi:uncharacterized protein [Antedon mediterranea]|uniref:uncharacterized protein n=1 Tax=Antedon mediterranea TaxID=105859 RepID=UPI003AF6080A
MESVVTFGRHLSESHSRHEAYKQLAPNPTTKCEVLFKLCILTLCTSLDKLLSTTNFLVDYYNTLFILTLCTSLDKLLSFLVEYYNTVQVLGEQSNEARSRHGIQMGLDMLLAMIFYLMIEIVVNRFGGRVHVDRVRMMLGNMLLSMFCKWISDMLMDNFFPFQLGPFISETIFYFLNKMISLLLKKLASILQQSYLNLGGGAAWVMDEQPNEDREQANEDREQPNEDREQENEDGEQPNEDGEQPNEDREQANEDGEQPIEDGEQPDEDREQSNEDREQPIEDGEQPNEDREQANEDREQPNEDRVAIDWLIVFSSMLAMIFDLTIEILMNWFGGRVQEMVNRFLM